MSACAKAAELIALADSMAGSFEVMSSTAVIGSIYPAYLCASDEAPSVSSWRPAFPAWLQKKGAQNKAQSMAREMHSRMRAISTCSCKSLTTTNFHDLLYRRLLHPLTFGDTKSCAAMLHASGLTREFFTDQAPALRIPLLLDDSYKRIDGNHKHQLLQDLKSYEASVTSTKRKKAGADADGSDGEDGKRAKNAKKKPEAKKAAKSSSGAAAAGSRSHLASLGHWLPKKECDAAIKPREATLILKFIEGHTNAVRRKVTMPELLGPWRDF